MIVTGHFAAGPNGGWMIGVAPHDPKHEDEAIPDWPIRIDPGKYGYSPIMTVEAPDDVKVTLLMPGIEG